MNWTWADVITIPLVILGAYAVYLVLCRAFLEIWNGGRKR